MPQGDLLRTFAVCDLEFTSWRGALELGQEHSALFECRSFAAAIAHLCHAGAVLPEGCLPRP
ncbi:hypothetical protein SAMN06272771_0468 [Streptomyces sp. Ag82_O1-12]|nr:hypothetical protein SAMN06272771_0468 [Streptomyces sp. Ag82_O1-12]SOD43207.1 hypothetical protein SAMN06272727_0458 [Streptomyces sp. Ag82_G6-1]